MFNIFFTIELECVNLITHNDYKNIYLHRTIITSNHLTLEWS